MDNSRSVKREQRQLMQAEQVDLIKTASLEEACSLMRGFANAWGGFENCPTVLEAFMARLNIRSASQPG